MILPKDIIKDGHETLRNRAIEVLSPLSRKDKDKGKEMLKYLKMSQDEELSKKYDMVAGVGLAAPQINISKRFFACLFYDGKKDYEYVIYNPIILEKSDEMVYLSSGEGCLSIPNVSGIVPRYKKIKVKGIVLDNIAKTLKEDTLTFEGYAAVVFQHEFDHLDGILFTDKVVRDNLEKYEPIN